MAVPGIVKQSLSSLLGFIPPALVDILGITFQRAYWLLIAFGLVFFVGQCVFFLLSVKGEVIQSSRKKISFFLNSKGLVLKFSILSFLTSVAFGVFISLFPFYVNQKLGIQSDALGTLMFLSSFASAARARSSEMAAMIYAEVLSVLDLLLLTCARAPSFFNARWHL